MNSPVCALRTASVIFGLMGLAHLIRIFVAINVQIGTHLIGRRWSAVAFVVLAALCVWLWRAASAADKKPADASPSAAAPVA